MENLAAYFSLNHILVYLFLLVTLGVGLYVGKGIKDIKDYAIARNTFGSSTLILTFLATAMGGATTVGLAAKTFSDGIIMTVAILGYIISYLFVAIFIAPKMKYFKGSITPGDVIGKLCGETSRVVTGSVGFFYSSCIVAAQLIATGLVFESLLGIGRNTGIAIGGLIVVAYATFGGVKSVAITDVIQLLVLVVMIPLVAGAATGYAGGLEQLWRKVPAEKFVVFGHEKFVEYLAFFLVWGVLPTNPLSPPFFQRMLMAKDRKQISGMFTSAAFFMLPLELMVMLIGLGAFVSYPEINPNAAFPHIIKMLLPIGTQGLCIAGLIAAIMSTGDSFLNAGALLFSHDVVMPFCNRRKKEIDELKLVKFVTFTIGMVAIVLAALWGDVIKLVFFGLSLFGIITTVPLTAGILGLKTDSQSFFIALFIAVITFIIAILCLDRSLRELAPIFGIIANGISFFAVHLIRNKGFASVKREEA
ncbi:MAG: sodium:solute symporter family protein [Cytophagales bacterium]|nr:sodium:solute symporter family protein [Cytophagales bacterium]